MSDKTTLRHSILAMLGIVSLVAFTGWVFTSGPFGYYSPSEKTQSAFFRDYPQKQVQDITASFAARQVGSLASEGSGAGRKFVTNRRTLELRFAIQPGKSSALLTALSDDMTAHLRQEGAEILTHTSDPGTGLHLTYRLGHALGTATLAGSFTNRFAPHYTQSGAMVDPPAGTRYMAVDIAISEHWFPKEEKTLQASAQDY